MNGAGHGEAAVKLQRDWIQDPQSLPYAQETKTHALVRLVQKGIQYYEIEKSISQVCCQIRSFSYPSLICSRVETIFYRHHFWILRLDEQNPPPMLTGAKMRALLADLEGPRDPANMDGKPLR